MVGNNTYNIKKLLDNKKDLLMNIIGLKSNIIYSLVYENKFNFHLDIIYNKFEDKYYIVDFYGLEKNNYNKFGGFEKLEDLYLYLLNNEFEKDLLELEINKHKDFIKRDYKTDEEKKELRKELRKFKSKLKYLNEVSNHLYKNVIN